MAKKIAKNGVANDISNMFSLWTGGFGPKRMIIKF